MTALYEIVPVGGPRAIGDLRYAKPTAVARTPAQRRVRLRQDPLQAAQVGHEPADLDPDRPRVRRCAASTQAPRDARFATAVAGFAELLRGGRYTGSLSYDDVLRIANASRGSDEFGYRSEFVELVRAAKSARTMAQLER